MDTEQSTLTLKQKYEFYEEAVQNPEGEVETLQDLYKKLVKKEAKVLREDFCGTGAIMCNWVKQGPEFRSFGIDLDPEPVKYGKERHLSRLTKEEQSRVDYIMGDVFETDTDKADIIAALNFSYFIFKKRKQLVEYFSRVRNNLANDGIFVLDLFGGPESMMPLEESTKMDGFKYYWDCDKYNPITHETLYHIHFKPKGGKKYKKVFTYDWRLWGFAELREILEDSGFSKSLAFWEGDDDDGGGNGEFFATEEIENCEGWVGYIVAFK